MAGTQRQFRRGTSAEHETFTGARGEVTVDITDNTLRVHDGVTVGGHTVPSAGAEAGELLVTSTNTDTSRTLSDRFAEALNVKDYGLVGDGSTNDAAALEALLRVAVPTHTPIYFPVGDYFIGTDINITDISGSLVFVGAPRPKGRGHVNYRGSVLRFNENGTSTTGRVGIDLQNNTPFHIDSMRLETLIEDARTTGGDFIGIRGQGTDCSLTNSMVIGFTVAFEASDLGYSNWGYNNYRGNHTMLRHVLIDWPAGTTFRDEGSIAVQHVNVYNVPALWHSSWVGCTYEYCDIPILDFQNGCSIEHCYFEANATAGAQSLTAAADIVLVSNYYNTLPGDGVYTSNNTTTHGFDRCGKAILDGNQMHAKDHRFYNRKGEDSYMLSAAATGATSAMHMLDADRNFIGFVQTGEGGGTDVNNSINHTASMSIRNGAIYGPNVPDGWTFTKNADGDYTVNFGTNYRNPIVQITTTGVSTNATHDYKHRLIMSQSAGGSWSTYTNADGFLLYTYFDNGGAGSFVLSDSVHAFITVSYSKVVGDV